MKRIVVHPRLAAAVCFFAYLLFFLILEKITSFHFVSEYLMILGIIYIPIGIIIYNKFVATYNRKKNDDNLFTIIALILLILFFVLLFVF